MIDLDQEVVPVEDILVDPNNPRFFNLGDYEETIPEENFDNQAVQRDALRDLNSQQLGKIESLISSIRSNGYVPAESIILREHEHSDKYVVVEGNRRIAAIKEILDQPALDDEQQELHDSLEDIPALIYRGSDDEEEDLKNVTILQGLRHVSGPKEWGAFQKANLVVKMHDELGQSFDEIDQRMGLGPRITPRYYRAYKALDQMMEDDEFGQLAEPNLFTLFEEAIRKPGIRDWLDWNDDDCKFESPKRTEFYELIVGDPEEDIEPRINNPRQMRDLGDMLAANKMTQVQSFLSGIIDIETAKSRAFPPDKTPLIDILDDCINALSDLSTDETRNLGGEEIEAFDQIVDLIELRKQDHEALSSVNKNE